MVPVTRMVLAALALAGCAAGTGPDAMRIGEGEMRTERAPPDATFTNGDLVDNFRDVVLRAEFSDGGADARSLPMTRWDSDITFAVRGAGVDDRVAIDAHLEHLSGLTGLAIAEAEPDDDPDMIIAFLPRADRAEAARGIAREIGAERFGRMASVWAGRSGDACLVITRLDDPKGSIVAAGIMIKDELAAAHRKACIVEELAQAMGPLNDSPAARPSIFNDDQEFAALTEHDEFLLRILYDDRLEAGMEDDEALPLVAEIADDLRPDEARMAGR